MVENLCCHKMSAQLYSQLKVVCDNHVSSCVNQFLSYPLLSVLTDDDYRSSCSAFCWFHCFLLSSVILLLNIFKFWTFSVCLKPVNFSWISSFRFDCLDIFTSMWLYQTMILPLPLPLLSGWTTSSAPLRLSVNCGPVRNPDITTG